MVEKLAQRSALMGSPSMAVFSGYRFLCNAAPLRLCPVDGIKSLVEKKPDGERPVHPGRHVLIHCRVVPQHGQEIDYDEAEAGQRDLYPWTHMSKGKSDIEFLMRYSQHWAWEPLLAHAFQSTLLEWRVTYAIDMGKHLIATLL